MRVVVYAEGGRELGESKGIAPGQPIPEESLGPAHVLVQRVSGVVDVVFEGPLLKKSGSRYKGSDLLKPKRLLQALTWPAGRPDLAVVFVDCDGHAQRYPDLESIIERRKQRLPVVGAVPVQEFEAWLLADHACVQRLTRETRDQPPAVETMAPNEAKRLFEAWLVSAEPEERPRRALKRRIAESIDLDEVARRCPSFDRFRRELATALRG